MHMIDKTTEQGIFISRIGVNGMKQPLAMAD